MAEEEKLLKDAKELPWKDRLMHENWKVRREANIDLGAICSVAEPKEPGLHQFGELGFRVFPSSCVCVFKPAMAFVVLPSPFFSSLQSSFVEITFAWAGPLFKDAVSDSNALVREVALDALTAYLNHVDAGEARR